MGMGVWGETREGFQGGLSKHEDFVELIRAGPAKLYYGSVSASRYPEVPDIVLN